MTYETFLSSMEQQLQAKLEESATVKLHKILKNNHTQLEGLAFHDESSEISPTIYLNGYFIQHQEGRSIAEIVEEIYALYNNNKGELPFNADIFRDFNNLRQSVAYKIIDYNSNLKLLASVPHKRFLDLAIVYYLILDKNCCGNLTALIQNQHMKLWNVDIDTIHQLADHNTPYLLPYNIKDIEVVLRELFDDELLNDISSEILDENQCKSYSPPMYVLTNDIGINGAACLLYNNVLMEFATKLGQDLVILPSSIHELLLLPKEDEMCMKDFVEMVYDINENQVQPEDRLCNQVYLYSLKTNSITFAI